MDGSPLWLGMGIRVDYATNASGRFSNRKATRHVYEFPMASSYLLLRNPIEFTWR